jgi:hypothetical protein
MIISFTRQTLFHRVTLLIVILLGLKWNVTPGNGISDILYQQDVFPGCVEAERI